MTIPLRVFDEATLLNAARRKWEYLMDSADFFEACRLSRFVAEKDSGRWEFDRYHGMPLDIYFIRKSTCRLKRSTRWTSTSTFCPTAYFFFVRRPTIAVPDSFTL